MNLNHLTSPKLLFNFTIISLVFTISALLVREIYDLDVWWQVTIGREILSSIAIPDTDAFSGAGFGRPYHDSHWLFQVGLAFAHHVWGMNGVQGFSVAIWTIALVACWLGMGKEKNTFFGLFLLFLVAVASIERFLPRPEIITFVMISVFYWRLGQGNFAKKTEYLLFLLLQVIWTNCHGLFVIGPFMVGCYWAVALIRKIKGHESDFFSLSFLIVLVTLATLLTPFGIEGWKYAFLLFQESGPEANEILKDVGELSSVFGDSMRRSPAFWSFAILTALSLTAIGLKNFKGGLSAPRTMILLGLLAAALTGRRNVVLFALVAGPFIAEHLRVLFHLESRWKVPIASVCLALMWSMAWWGFSGRFYTYMQLPTRFGLGATPSYFPHSLMESFPSHLVKGQVFNSNNGGGFFLFHNFPRHLPLTDGRWEVYDQKELATIRRATALKQTWSELIDTYDIQALLLLHASPESDNLMPGLVTDEQWRLVGLDKAGSLWLRSELVPDDQALDLHSASLSIQNVSRIDDALILDRFLRAAGLKQARILNLQRALQLGPTRLPISLWLAQAQLEQNDYVGAEKSFSDHLETDPDNLVALSELAFITYQRTAYIEARGYLLRILEIDPANQEALANLKILDATNVVE